MTAGLEELLINCLTDVLEERDTNMSKETRKNNQWVSTYLLEHGVRKTKAREQMLQLMADFDRPMEAQELFEELQHRHGEDGIWLSTVYRNLELFLQKHIVQSISPIDSDSLLYRLELHGHRHYAVCERCHEEIALDMCPIHEIVEQLKQQGFQATAHRLEVFGICSKCQSKKD